MKAFKNHQSQIKNLKKISTNESFGFESNCSENELWATQE